MSADIDKERTAAFLRDTIKLHDEWAADRTAQAFGTPYKAWLAAKYPCEVIAARATPSPAPIQQSQQDSCISPLRAEPAGAYKQTDLSKRLRHAATNPMWPDHIEISKELLVKACDEIDRYYTGMLNWKATAEAKDAEASAPAGAAKSGNTNPCKACNGEGVIHTGIDEAPTSDCRTCDGSGLAPTVKASQ